MSVTLMFISFYLERKRKISQFLTKFDVIYIILVVMMKLTQALHTERINLSPFTKDFRVWGASIETNLIYLRVPLRRSLLRN
jgi:hypothetical protein